MKLLHLISTLLAISPNNYLLANEPSEATLEFVFREIQSACTGEAHESDCISTIERIRNAEDYQNPRTQIVLSQSLLPIARTHPEALNIAHDILTDLLETNPEDLELVGLRATVRYHQDPIQGIWEARKNDVPGTLSILLRSYLESGQIQRDIKAFAIEKFKLRISNEDKIGLVLSSARIALESIIKYGNESEADEFILEARNLIPWRSWRQGEWALTVSKTELGARSAKQILHTYCQPVMLKLDEGEYCSAATAFILQSASNEVFNDEEFQQMARLVKTKVEEMQPKKIGNAIEILEQIQGLEQQ